VRCSGFSVQLRYCLAEITHGCADCTTSLLRALGNFSCTNTRHRWGSLYFVHLSTHHHS
jgi:hypothetical protein